MVIRLIALGCVLGLWACDDAAPTTDPPYACAADDDCAPGLRCVEGACLSDGADLGAPPPVRQPDAGPDANPAPDAAPRDAGRADAEADAGADAAACHLGPEPAPPAPEGLADLQVRHEIRVGGPLRTPEMLPWDLDGAPDDRAELLVVRGGRAEALGADGRPWWSSPVLGIEAVIAVTDFDGDGRQEVVVRAARALHLLDALTGAEIWRSPDRPFGQERAPIVQVLRVLIADVTGDDLPDLYLTDGGCTGGGTGLGATFTFAAGFDVDAPLAIIDGPRIGGRCTRWQTLSDVDGDGTPELLLPDAAGLHAFDAATGARRYCGPIADTAGDTRLPHLPLALDEDTPTLAVFDRERVLLMAVAPGGVPGCPDAERALHVRWSRALGGRIEPTGSAAVDVDDDGVLDLLTSARDADGWRTVALSGEDGATLLELPATRLLGVVPGGAGPQLLTAEAPSADPEQFEDIQQRRLERAPLAAPPIWPAPRRLLSPIREPLRAPDRTSEFTPLFTLDAGAGARAVFLRADASGVRTTGLALLDPDRGSPLSGQPGGVHRPCGPGGCEEGLVMAWEDGAVATYDSALVGAPALPLLPTGQVTVTRARDGERAVLMALTVAGSLAAFDLSGDEPVERWRASLGAGARRHPLGVGRREEGPDLLVAQDFTRNATGWRALAADGRTLWLSVLDEARWRGLSGGAVVTIDGRADVVLRFDLLRDATTWRSAPECRWDTAPADLAEPLPTCPGRTPTAQTVLALDAETGLCRWRTTLRPNVCSTPTNQRLSVADADADGRPEIYVTSTNELLRLDPADGAVADRVDLGLLGASARGGGALRVAPDPALVRFGGNGPIDAFDAELRLRWRAAAPDGLRNQSWLFREALITDAEAWVSPGPGLPIHRYALAAEGEAVEPVATVGLADGALAADDLAEVRTLQRDPEIRPGIPGALITADDGWLYALDLGGALAWSRRFPAVIGLPLVADLDADGARELAVPLDDGRVQIADLPGPPPPSIIWDLPCPARPTCDPESDIDVTTATTKLCGEWIPVEGVQGYEIRAVDRNGAVLSEWRDVGMTTYADIDGLALVPRVRYHLEVRSRWPDGRPGVPGSSDGVVVINDAPPTVEISADPERAPRGGRIAVTLRARDDDLLAGWALLITTDEGLIVQRLGGGPLALSEYEVRRDWSADDRNKDPVPPGRYRAVATVVDRGRNTARAEAIIDICDGPCP